MYTVTRRRENDIGIAALRINIKERARHLEPVVVILPKTRTWLSLFHEPNPASLFVPPMQYYDPSPASAYASGRDARSSASF